MERVCRMATAVWPKDATSIRSSARTATVIGDKGRRLSRAILYTNGILDEKAEVDAVVAVQTEKGDQRFALEYERSPKPMRFYWDIVTALGREARVSQVLYLVSNYDLLQFISGFFRNSQSRVFFGLVKDWHAQLLDMPVSGCSASRCIPFRETLGEVPHASSRPHSLSGQRVLPFL